GVCKVWFGDLSDRSFHTEFPSQVIYTSEQLFSGFRFNKTINH
ncbi:hypothetical protein EDC91_13044, partial [Shewanella fodinae]